MLVNFFYWHKKASQKWEASNYPQGILAHENFMFFNSGRNL